MKQNDTVETNKSRILIAEDQLINIAVLKQHLSDMHIEKSCDFTYDGLEAVEKAKKIISE